MDFFLNVYLFSLLYKRLNYSLNCKVNLNVSILTENAGRMLLCYIQINDLYVEIG